MRRFHALMSSSAHRLAVVLIAVITSAVVVIASPVGPALAADGTLTLNASGPATVAGGGNVNYTMTYSCSGPVSGDTCAGAVITAPLPTYLDIDGQSQTVTYAQSTGSPDTVDNGVYNPATNSVTFTFGTGFVGGHTGSVSLIVGTGDRVTPNGTVLVLQPTFVLNAQTVTATAVRTTVATATKLSATKVTTNGSTQAGVGAEVEYKIEGCPTGPGPNIGILPADDMVLTDVFPAGTVFVSSIPAPSVQTATQAQFRFPGRTVVGRCNSAIITLRYPAPAFSVNQTVTNRVDASATQPGSGGAPATAASASHDLTLRAGDIVTFKLASVSQVPVAQRVGTTFAVGDTIGYGTSFKNSGSVPIDNVRVVATVPTKTRATAVFSGLTTPSTTVTVEYSTDGGANWVVAGVRSTTASSRIAIPAGTSVDLVRWTYASAPVNFSTDPVYPRGAGIETVVINPDRGGVSYTVPPATDLDTCATIQWISTASPFGATQSSCVHNTIDATPVPLLNADGTGSLYRRGETIRPTVQINNTGTSSTAPLARPIVSALLPAGFSFAGATTWVPLSSGITSAPDLVQTFPNFGGSGRTLVQWKWSTPVAIIRGGSSALQYGIQVDPTAALRVPLTVEYRLGNEPSGAQITACASGAFRLDADDRDGDGSATDSSCSFNVFYYVEASSGLVATKLVSGEPTLTAYAGSGTTYVGGLASYSVRLANNGSQSLLAGAQFIDLLPGIGDTYVRSAGVSRNSQFAPLLTGPITGPGFTVDYSQTANPCRTEIGAPVGAACTAPNWGPWTAAFDANPALVKSIRITVNQPIASGGSFEARWQMRVPFDYSLVGKTTYNSFAYTATTAANSTFTSEAASTQLQVTPAPSTYRIGDFVWQDNDIDGIQDPAEPGLAGVALELRTLGADGLPNTADDALASTATSDAAGQYAFTGVAPGTYYVHVAAPANMLFSPPDVGPDTTDSDLIPTSNATIANSAAFAFCSGSTPCGADATRDVGLYPVAAQLAITPFLNGSPAQTAKPGTHVPVNNPLTWSYNVTNAGNVALTGVGVRSALGNPACVLTTLNPNQSTTCTLPTVSATVGDNSVAATIHGQPPTGPEATNVVTTYAFGTTTGVSMTVTTNGTSYTSPNFPYIPVNDPVEWIYSITNSGNADLTGATITDSVGTLNCPGLVPAGTTVTCTRTTTAAPGRVTGLATLNANSPLGPLSARVDLDYFGYQGGITVEKRLDGDLTTQSPPTYVPVLSTLNWTYVVTNHSNLAVTNLVITDSREAAPNCGTTSLAPAGQLGDSVTCTSTGSAAAGEIIGRAIAAVDSPSGGQLTDDDTAYYFGLISDLDLQVMIETVSAPVPTGPFIVLPDTADWHYSLTNRGNADVKVVGIADSNGGTVCTRAVLKPNEEMTCDRSVPASPDQFTNNVRANATDVRGQPVPDTATSYYFGVDGGVSIQKLLDGNPTTSPGPFKAASTAITWTYEITNTGNVDITVGAGSVTDDVETTLVCPPNRVTLAANQSTTCTLNSTATAGRYAGTASVSATRPNSLPPVTAEDTGYYTGATTALSVATTINNDPTGGLGAPGVYVPVGQPVTWSYEVVNTGSEDLVNVRVSDTLHPSLSGCPPFTLAANGGSHICTVTEPAVKDGQTSTVNVTATTVLSTSVNASQNSYYFGSAPALTVETKVLNDDADNPATAPTTPTGQPVTWQYVVSNVGNVQLDGVSIADDGQGTITCPSTPLVVGQTVTCERTDAAALPDLHTNTASASATGPNGSVSSPPDSASYFGVSSQLTVDVTTNGIAASAAPGPFLAIDDPVTWTYLVTNRGNTDLIDVTLADDVVGVITNCPSTTLAAGASMSCSADGLVKGGQYTNTATATAMTVLNTTISGNGTSFYFGTVPSLRLVVRVNGAAGDTPSGPFVASGSPVSFAFDVTNIGDGPLANILVVQDPATGPITCPRTTLAVNQTMTCTAETTAAPGQFSSIVTASGNVPDPASPLPIARAASTRLRIAAGPTAFVRVTSAGNYFGVVSGIAVSALTNGINSSSAPGLVFDVGSPLVWSYVVSNPGNTTINSIVLTDDRLGVVTCPKTSLAPSESMTCTVNGSAVVGLYQNRATVNGANSIGSVSASDDDFYTGRGTNAEPVPAEPEPMPPVPTATPLPITGSNTSGPLQVGATLLVAGIILTAVRRRRRAV